MLQRVPRPVIAVTEEERGFAAYLHYLRSIYGLIRTLYPSNARLVEVCQSGQAFQRLQRNAKADVALVQRRLSNAWSTETSMHFARELDDELVRYMNHWAPVQSYYAVYLELQAIVASANRPPVRDHRGALRSAAEDLRSGRLCAPPPWSLLCTGENAEDSKAFMNVPPGEVVEQLSVMALPTPDRWWSFTGLALRTTRSRLVDERAADWKRRNPTKQGRARRSIPRVRRAELDRALHPTSLFDFMYRLRVRSNYVDSGTIVEGGAEEGDARAFNDALLGITEATLLVLEAHVQAFVGRNQFEGMAQQFFSRLPGRMQERPLRQRLEALGVSLA